MFLLALYLIAKRFFALRSFDKSFWATNRNYEHSSLLFYLRFIFLSLFICLLFFSLLRPQWGQKILNSESSGIDIVFVLDVSQSMNALDLSSVNKKQSRLAAAKKMIADFVEKNQNNRYSLVIFAGEAFVSTPLTSDIPAFLTFLSAANTDSVRKQGTDLVAALKSSVARLESNKDNDRGLAIVLLSDGGDEVKGDFVSLAKKIKDKGVSVITVGLGGNDPVPIPMGQDPFGRTIYKKYLGKDVLVKLNEKPLKEIAALCNGEYLRVRRVKDFNKISKQIKKMKSTKIKNEQQISGEDRYQYFLLPALVFFLFFLFLPRTKPHVKFINIFKKIFPFGKISFLLFLLFFLTGCSNHPLLFRYFLQQGNNSYHKNYFAAAKENYSRAEKYANNNKYIPENNNGIIYYREREWQKAATGFARAAAECKTNTNYCAQIHYNLGNTYYRLGEEATSSEIKIKKWQQAIDEYKADLAINSEDKQAQENIDFIMKKLSAEQKSLANKEQGANNKENQKDNKQNGVGQEKSVGNDKGKQQTNTEENNNSAQNKKEESSGATKKNKQKNSAEKDKNGSGSDNQEKNGAAEKSNSLTENERQQLERYEQNLDQQERDLQKYFQQTPSQKKPRDPFADLFNDPFFRGFFGDFNWSGGLDEQNNNEKDW